MLFKFYFSAIFRVGEVLSLQLQFWRPMTQRPTDIICIYRAEDIVFFIDFGVSHCPLQIPFLLTIYKNLRIHWTQALHNWTAVNWTNISFGQPAFTVASDSSDISGSQCGFQLLQPHPSRIYMLCSVRLGGYLSYHSRSVGH